MQIGNREQALLGPIKGTIGIGDKGNAAPEGAAKGKTYPLVGKVVSMGSGPENSVRIMDGAVSGKHAGIAVDGNKFEIVDLGSKNGVLVNGKKTARRFLRNGDIITLGMTEFKFESSVAAPDDEAED